MIPRQRPKAVSAAPLSLNKLPGTISSSPTTVNVSRSPVTLAENSRSLSPKQSNPHPNVSPFSPTTQTFSTVPAYPTQKISFLSSQNVLEKDLDILFQTSSYPDPFWDDAEGNTAKLEVTGRKQVSDENLPVSPQENSGLDVGQTVFSKGKSMNADLTGQCIVGTSNTPPSTPTLSVSKGHRRNMSDTTAFNK